MARRVVFACVASVLVLPWPTAESPDWTVRVIDNHGMPVESINVRESYKNYSAEMTDHELTLIAGHDGLVRFPAKTLWRPLLLRLPVLLISTLGGVHASFGPHASAFAFGEGLEGDIVKDGYIYDWHGAPQSIESKLVVHSIGKSD